MRIVELKEEAIITDEELCTILEGPELDVDNLQHLNLSFNKIQSLNGIEKVFKRLVSIWSFEIDVGIVYHAKASQCIGE